MVVHQSTKNNISIYGSVLSLYFLMLEGMGEKEDFFSGFKSLKNDFI